MKMPEVGEIWQGKSNSWRRNTIIKILKVHNDRNSIFCVVQNVKNAPSHMLNTDNFLKYYIFNEKLTEEEMIRDIIE